MGYAYTSKREKQGEETKQLKKKEKEVQRQKAERSWKSYKGELKRKDRQKRGREYGNKTMNERKDWWRKKDTYWCQTNSNNQTQGLHGSKDPLPGKKEVM